MKMDISLDSIKDQDDDYMAPDPLNTYLMEESYALAIDEDIRKCLSKIEFEDSEFLNGTTTLLFNDDDELRRPPANL